MDIEQINISIQVNEETKKTIIDSLKNTNDIKLKTQLLSQLKEIDENIIYYNSLKIKKSKNNIYNTNYIDDTSIDHEVKENIITDITKTNKNKKSKLIINLKIYIEAINKTKERKYKKVNDIQNQEEIILAERHLKYDNKDYKYYDKNKDMIIIFKTQTISKKVIFYQCKKRPKCKGTAKLKLINEEIQIIKECDNNIDHDLINFDKFYEAYQKKILRILILQIKNYKNFIYVLK